MKRNICALVLLGAAFGFSRSVRAEDLCEEHLLPTSELVSYLETLIDARVLDTNDLSLFAENLDRGVLVNPLSAASPSTAVTVHRTLLATLIQQLSLPSESEDVRRWVQRRLESLNDAKGQRETVQGETVSTQLPFEKFDGGGIKIKFDKVDVPPFEIMAYLVSERQWRHLMGAPNAGSLPMHPTPDDLPVKSISWWSAAEFTNRFSAALGLEPYYRMEDVQWNGAAEDGSLMPVSASEAFDMIQKANEAQRNGYRLPNEEEIEYLLDLGGEDLEKKNETLWLSKNLDHFHALTAHSPVVFSEKHQQLYDLLGGLTSWLNKGVVFLDYDKPPFIEMYVSKGSGVRLSTVVSRGNDRPCNTVGFRLARTLPPPNSNR